MAKDFNADRYLTRRWAAGTPAIVYYVRPGGDNDLDGLTPVTAFATLEWALHHMAVAEVNQDVVIDVTGMTIAASSVLQLGGTTLGGISFDLDLAATSPNNFASKRHRQIRAELKPTTALVVTAQAFNATTGLLTLTVNNVLVANTLRGKFAVGAALGEYGVIQSNSGGAGPNTVVVANLVGFTLPVGVYEPGASLTFGDPANAFEQAINLLALADWSLQGLTIESTAASKAAAISIWPVAPVDLTLCDIAGIEIADGPGVVLLDGCNIRDKTFAQNGATVTAQQCCFRSLSFLCHGSGASGLNEIIGNFFDLCGPFGGGNQESRYSFSLQNCQVNQGTQEGVHALFGVSSLRNCIIQACAKSGVIAQNQVSLLLDNVQGAANTGFGLEASYGANVRPTNGTAVTGTTNDASVGAVGAVAWAATPVTDLDQLVRVGA